MTNSKDGHGNKDEYLDTSRKTLSQEMQYENSNIYVYYVFRSYDQCQFFIERSDVMVKRFKINRKTSLIIRNIHVKYQSSHIYCSKGYTQDLVLKK